MKAFIDEDLLRKVELKTKGSDVHTIRNWIGKYRSWGKDEKHKIKTAEQAFHRFVAGVPLGEIKEAKVFLNWN